MGGKPKPQTYFFFLGGVGKAVREEEVFNLFFLHFYMFLKFSLFHFFIFLCKAVVLHVFVCRISHVFHLCLVSFLIFLNCSSVVFEFFLLRVFACFFGF